MWRGRSCSRSATTSLLLGLLDTGRPYVSARVPVSAQRFILHTRRVAEPIIPIRVVGERIVATGALATGLAVMAQFGAISFVAAVRAGGARRIGDLLGAPPHPADARRGRRHDSHGAVGFAHRPVSPPTLLGRAASWVSECCCWRRWDLARAQPSWRPPSSSSASEAG